MRRVRDKPTLPLQQVIHLHQQAVQRGLHRFQVRRQRFKLQRSQRIAVPPANGLGHGAQGLEAPADGQPDQQRQQRHANQDGPEGVADDALDHVLANVVALAHPDQQALLHVGEHERAPVIAVFHQVVRPEGGGRCVEDRRAGGAHQQLTVGAPYLEGQAGFVGVRGAVFADTAHGLIESLVEAVPVGIAGIALAQYALQQTGALGELGVVDFFDFVVAVPQHEPTDQAITQQDQHQYRNEDARADRIHGLSSTM